MFVILNTWTLNLWYNSHCFYNMKSPTHTYIDVEIKKLEKCMWWVMQQSPTKKQNKKVVKLLNWDFLDLWKLEKVEGERSSRTIRQTYKHTCRMAGMEGDICTLKETKKDRCFVMHMSSSANKNTKKHLEEVKEHLQIWKIPLCILLSLYKNFKPHNIRVQTPHKAQKKGLQISPKCCKKLNTLCRWLRCSTSNQREHDKW